MPCTKALKSTLDAAYRRAAVILTTKTGRSYSKRYLAQQWEKTCKAAGIVDLHFHDIRGTTVTMLAEAGCTLPEIVSIAGHTLRRAQDILDKYLDRLVHHATIFEMNVESYRRRAALEECPRSGLEVRALEFSRLGLHAVPRYRIYRPPDS